MMAYKFKPFIIRIQCHQFRAYMEVKVEQKNELEGKLKIMILIYNQMKRIVWI